MDPFSITVGTVGLLGAALSSLGTIGEKIKAINNAPESLRKLNILLPGLSIALIRARSYFGKLNSNAAIEERELLSWATGVIQHCIEEVDAINMILERSTARINAGSGARYRWRIRWILRDEQRIAESLTSLTELNKHLQLFISLINAENSHQTLDKLQHLDSRLVSSNAEHSAPVHSYNEVLEHVRNEIAIGNAQLLRNQKDLLSEVAQYAHNRGSIQEASRQCTSDADSFACMLRQQLIGLLPEITECISTEAKKEVRGYPKALETAINKAVNQAIGEHSQESPEHISNAQTCTTPDSIKNGLPHQSTRQSNRRCTLPEDGVEAIRHDDTYLSRNAWCLQWTVGTLYIQISRTSGRYGRRDGQFQIKITFRPNSALFTRGLTALWASKLDSRGYAQLSPMISTFAVVPRDAEVFRQAISGNIYGLRKLFAEGRAAPTDQDPYGFTLLHVAARTFNFEIVSELVKEGADTSVMVPVPESANSFSAIGYMDRMLMARLNSYGDKNTLSRRYERELFDSYLNTYRLLLRNGCDNSMGPWLYSTIQSFRGFNKQALKLIAKWLRLLSDGIFDFNARQDNALSFFLEAVMTAQAAVVRILLNEGGDITARDLNGHTVLHLAMLRFGGLDPSYDEDTIDLLLLLIKAGADVHAHNCYDQTPLHYAMGCERLDQWLYALYLAGVNLKHYVAQEIRKGSVTSIEVENPTSFSQGTLRRRQGYSASIISEAS